LIDAAFADEQVALLYDALVRVEGASALGSLHYVPVLCYEGEVIRQQQRLLLAILGLVLGLVQGRQPASGLVIYGSACRQAKVRLTPKLTKAARDTLEAVKRLQAGGVAPPLMLNKHCPLCQFRRDCHSEAVRQDSLSLLRGLGTKEILKQNGKGIFTVTQLSYTFRPRRKGKRAKGQEPSYHPALQALAVREGKTYIFTKPTVPVHPTSVYLDLEGDADGAFVYLAGLLVVENGAEQMHSFWADGPAEEDGLLRQVLETVEGKEYALFHFGTYERAFLKRMRKAARRKTPVDRLLTNAVDVLALIRSNIYFPVYCNGLKDIGKHLGCVWTAPDASGAQSLVWRWKWEQTHDDALKQRLLAYNAEDCAALRRVVDQVREICANFGVEGGKAGTDASGAIEQVKASKRGTAFLKWATPPSSCLSLSGSTSAPTSTTKGRRSSPEGRSEARAADPAAGRTSSQGQTSGLRCGVTGAPRARAGT
jgi:predicted RecB family nuclease